ncbi:hypothetical protein [Bacillus sp. P14.5]|uniref:hypothetical protein n=1 Tax=Bacillus sp. P14.5 TaxID=1983400 RepID=UPI0013B06666|nr:hypothetical protein [Bacillus sp. P14.5]
MPINCESLPIKERNADKLGIPADMLLQTVDRTVQKGDSVPTGSLSSLVKNNRLPLPTEAAVTSYTTPRENEPSRP